MKTHTYKIAWKDLPQESVTRAMTGGRGPESGKPGLSHSVMGKPLRVSDQVSCTVRRADPKDGVKAGSPDSRASTPC